MHPSGAGILLIPCGIGECETTAKLEEAFANAHTKYGARLENTFFPIRVFSFAKARPFLSSDGQYLWDLRLEIRVQPGQIAVTPLSARLCPEPLDGTLRPETAIANLTGRREDGNRVVPPRVLVEGIGANTQLLEEMSQASAKWAVNLIDLVRPSDAVDRTGTNHRTVSSGTRVGQRS